MMEILKRLVLMRLRFGVSLLEESKQPPKYKQESALTAGWSIHSIPIEEGAAPSLEQIRKFMTLLESLPAQTKVLVFCESGQGRTAFMGAAYWVNKRLSASDAIVRMSKACATSEWATAERQRVLREYARLLGCQ